MVNQIRQAKINWLIPAKGVYSDGIDTREILVTKSYILNKSNGTKTYFKGGDTDAGVGAGVQFDDFKVAFPGRLLDIMPEHKNAFLAKFKTMNLNINLYANGGSGDMVPYITVTTQNKRNEYFLLVSNNNRNYDEVFSKKGRFVGYLGYNIYGCKLITVGRISQNNNIPLYIKNGKVTFTNDDDLQTSEKVVYDVHNLMLYNKDKSERVLYKRLFTCESDDFKIDVKFMKVMLPTEVSFDIYGKFVDANGLLKIDTLKDLKNNPIDINATQNGSVYVSSKFVYQFNVLYKDKETGEHKGVGYTYFPISI